MYVAGPTVQRSAINRGRAVSSWIYVNQHACMCRYLEMPSCFCLFLDEFFAVDPIQPEKRWKLGETHHPKTQQSTVQFPSTNFHDSCPLVIWSAWHNSNLLLGFLLARGCQHHWASPTQRTGDPQSRLWSLVPAQKHWEQFQKLAKIIITKNGVVTETILRQTQVR